MNKYISYISIIIIIIYYIWMSVNPIKYNYGNKNNILEYIKDHTMNFIYINYKRNYNFNNIKYPKIFKPVICSGCSQDVKVINNNEEAILYHNNIQDNYIIQDICYYKYEAGLLYERLPINNKGNIISIYQRHYENYNKLNIWNLDNNKYRYINKNNLISEKLIDKIDNIIKKIPNMYACRIDLKYNSDKDLLYGDDIIILEVNGVMGYDLGFYYNNCILNNIIILIRWLIIRLIIGLINIILFNGVNIFNVYLKLNERLYISFKCKNWEKIFEYVYT